MKNKSTYSLLINAAAEDKGRSIFELAIYGLVILCMAVAGWQFVSHPVTLPGKVRKEAPAEAMIANAPAPEAPVVIASRG